MAISRQVRNIPINSYCTNKLTHLHHTDTLSMNALLRSLEKDDVIVEIIQHASAHGSLQALVSRPALQRKLTQYMNNNEHVTENLLRTFCLNEHLWEDFTTLSSDLRLMYLSKYGTPFCVGENDSDKSLATGKKNRRSRLDHRIFLVEKNRARNVLSNLAMSIRKNAIGKISDHNDEMRQNEDKECVITESRLARDVCNAYVNALSKAVNDVADDDVAVNVIRMSLDKNEYDAEEVIMQSHKPSFDCHGDYLDMILQLGYLLQFAACCTFSLTYSLHSLTHSLTHTGPFTFLCALVNNWFEIQGDLFRLAWDCARPLPRDHQTIREWEDIIYWAPLISVPVTAGLVVLSTGQLERWGGLGADCDQKDNVMMPSEDCITNPLVRPLVWLVLIFVLESVILATYALVPQIPKSVKKHDAKVLESRQERLADMLVPQFSDYLYNCLKDIFFLVRTSSSSSSSSGKSCENKNGDRIDLHGLKRLMDMMQDSRKLPRLTSSQLSTLFSQMDVLSRGLISFSDFSAGLVHAYEDYTLRHLKLEQLNSSNKLVDALRTSIFSSRNNFLKRSSSSGRLDESYDGNLRKRNIMSTSSQMMKKNSKRSSRIGTSLSSRKDSSSSSRGGRFRSLIRNNIVNKSMVGSKNFNSEGDAAGHNKTL